MAASPITPTIPLDAQGIHHGFLRLPYSRNDSAWGSVMIPICVVRNGDGPTALLTGANHGDEYEGPVALQSLAHELEPNQIQGRVIILPFLNYPAFRNGLRCSPIDQGNLNRSFPGRPEGTVTEKIAHFVYSELLPLTDIVLDFHSGGRTLDFVPFACAHILEDKAQQAACEAAMRAFNAPYTMMMREIDSVGMLDTAVEEMGKVFVTTELGGGGTATAKSIRIAKKGVANVLKHAGIMIGKPIMEASIELKMEDGCFNFSENDGLIEPLVDLGEEVKRCDVLARIWPVDRTDGSPIEHVSDRPGILASRHFPGLIKSGDCLAVIAKRVG